MAWQAQSGPRSPLALAALAFACGVWLDGHLQRSPALWGWAATLLATCAIAAVVAKSGRLAMLSAVLALLCVGAFARIATPVQRNVIPPPECLTADRVLIVAHVTNDGVLLAGVDLVHVPYRGASPALTDLLGGRAQVMFEGMLSVVGHIRDGKLRALAVTPAKRSPLFPDIPSVGEFVPGYDASVWFGIGAQRDTPTEIIDRLNKEINAGLADPVIKQRLADLGGTPLVITPAEYEKLIAEDTEKWGKVVRAANITLESGR